MKNITIQECKRALIEQALSNDKDAYSVEDDRFLYYCYDGKTLHIAKGNADFSMPIEDWKVFAETMLRVSDEYFVTGEGKSLAESFLGWLLSKYSRRKEFASSLLEVIEDASAWAYA